MKAGLPQGKFPIIVVKWELVCSILEPPEEHKWMQTRDGKKTHFCSLRKSPMELTEQSPAASAHV